MKTRRAGCATQVAPQGHPRWAEAVVFGGNLKNQSGPVAQRCESAAVPVVGIEGCVTPEAPQGRPRWAKSAGGAGLVARRPTVQRALTPRQHCCRCGRCCPRYAVLYAHRPNALPAFVLLPSPVHLMCHRPLPHRPLPYAGCPLLAPLQLSSRICGCDAGFVGPQVQQLRAGCGAHVPCEQGRLLVGVGGAQLRFWFDPKSSSCVWVWRLTRSCSTFHVLHHLPIRSFQVEWPGVDGGSVSLQSRRSGPTRPSATWPPTRPSATQANSWGLAFAAPMVGARLVLPGPFLDGASVYKLLEEQRITHTAGECGCPGFVYGCVGRVVAGC